jgi:hypothetical protein
MKEGISMFKCMVIKVPSFGTSVMLVGATAMLADTAIYLASGSNGDAPDAAKVVLAASSTNSASPLNLHVTAVKALEPGQIRGEVPVHLVISRTVIKST